MLKPAALLAPLLTLGLDARAAEGAVALDLQHEALGIPGVRGLDLFRGALHPGLQAEGSLAYAGGQALSFGQGLRLGGWAHEGVGSLFYLTTVLRLELGLPADLRLLVEPAELGIGLAALPGDRYAVGESGLEASNDPLQLRVLGGVGLGLGWSIPESPLSLRLGYRAALELSPPPVFSLFALPHSTLSFGVAYHFGEEE